MGARTADKAPGGRCRRRGSKDPEGLRDNTARVYMYINGARREDKYLALEHVTARPTATRYVSWNAAIDEFQRLAVCERAVIAALSTRRIASRSRRFRPARR